MEHTICHFEIPARDLEAARTFYTGLFGWEVQAVPNLGEEYLFLRTSGRPGTVGGGLLKRVDERHNVTIYFTVESVEEAVQRAVDLGGTVLVPKTTIPKLGWAAAVRDPEGNCFGLVQEDPTAD
jgi:hypothetical protein